MEAKSPSEDIYDQARDRFAPCRANQAIARSHQGWPPPSCISRQQRVWPFLQSQSTPHCMKHMRETEMNRKQTLWVPPIASYIHGSPPGLDRLLVQATNGAADARYSSPEETFRKKGKCFLVFRYPLCSPPLSIPCHT